MEKEFIPYEQALSLKELGFDEPCFGYYDGNRNLQFMYNGYPEKFSERMMGVSDSVWVGWISVPLYQQAFRWFREKYGIVSFVKKEYKAAVEIGFYFGIDTLKHFKFIDFYSKPYKTYEEAELECLKKLIEIVKSKS